MDVNYDDYSSDSQEGDYSQEESNENTTEGETNETKQSKMIPYDRFKEIVDDRAELKSELLYMKRQIEMLTAPKAPVEEDDSSIDDNVKRYVEKNIKKSEGVINSLRYENDKLKAFINNPELRKHEKDLDAFIAQEYARGNRITLELASEIVLARKAEARARKRPVQDEQQTAQQTSRTPSQGVYRGDNGAPRLNKTPPQDPKQFAKWKEEQIMNVPL